MWGEFGGNESGEIKREEIEQAQEIAFSGLREGDGLASEVSNAQTES